MATEVTGLLCPRSIPASAVSHRLVHKRQASSAPATFRQARSAPCPRQVVRQLAAAVSQQSSTEDIEHLTENFRKARQKYLEDQALGALEVAESTFERPVFPCALIAGDVVLLHLLHRQGFLDSGKVKVVFIDTFHLFPETHELLHRLEAQYNFKAEVFHAKDLSDKKAYDDHHGSDLFIRDIDAYDRICKVEPFNRSLQELEADVMINGRRRDHGAERGQLEEFEKGTPVKCNPLAWWTFKDCFEYLDRHQLDRHPLHSQGYPSVGDVHSTLPVPEAKWFEYGGERSGRFQGIKNADGSAKTECGIHQPGSDPSSGLSNIRR